jgi:hypothetical protein
MGVQVCKLSNASAGLHDKLMDSTAVDLKQGRLLLRRLKEAAQV